MVDARSIRFETLTYAFDSTNPLTGERPTIKDLSAHASSLRSPATENG
jgi:adenylyltransferase/sulfurtransferase